MSSPLTPAVIGLESCNILLLSLLLATPVPKHAMVKSLMVACLLRSVMDVLPPIVERAHPADFWDALNSGTALVSFCVSFSILLRYVTVVKAAFAVSFTLPALWLSFIQIRPKRSADDYPRLTERTVLLLCLLPYVWALPVLVVPIPQLIRGQINPVSFHINSCYFDNQAFTIVSLIFTLIPLAFAVLISGAVLFVVSRWSDTTSIQRAMICTKRSIRFASLVLVTVISASFYTVVLVLWVEGRGSWDKDWAAVRLSVMWEAITPMLFFVIFAAQEEIYETWLHWLSRIVYIPQRARPSVGANPSLSHFAPAVTYDSYLYPTSHPTYSKVPNDVEAPIGNAEPTFPGKIVQRPMSMKHSRNSIYRSQSIHDVAMGPSASCGLPPPPRHDPAAPKIRAEEPAKTSRFRLPFRVVHNLSLSAFGSQPSMQSQLHSSSLGEYSAPDDGGALATTSDSDEKLPQCEGPRSHTPMSTRTFGGATASRN
ncbi:hypothetical protein C2E23DRAFT_168518 [Lenzites betulinus]|nr:hypothetical protein C2E23DRAFT_168518 [Lenzites betulinus]